MKTSLCALAFILLAGCATYERPDARIVPIPEPSVPNAVESIPQAAQVMIGDLVARSRIKQPIRVAFLPVQNQVLDPGVSISLENSLKTELVAREVFAVLKDIDVSTVRRALALEHGARAFLEETEKIDLGRRLGADAVITCTVSDAIQHWQLHVDLTPISSNVVASSADCYLPKRLARRSQIYTP